MSAMTEIGFVIYPQLTQLDVTGPAEILSRAPNTRIHMLWKRLEPVKADAGFSINPTTAFADSPQLDVLCVSGGMGALALMEDEETLEFLRRQADGARYVTSVCTGSLLLGAAGLLRGYEAACHWAFLDHLPQFGATPVARRLARDRNRITGGGVTAGIDFGLALAAELAGEQAARMIQLSLEYDPKPPFDSGSPHSAAPELVDAVRAGIDAALSS